MARGLENSDKEYRERGMHNDKGRGKGKGEKAFESEHTQFGSRSVDKVKSEEWREHADNMKVETDPETHGGY